MYLQTRLIRVSRSDMFVELRETVARDK